MLELPLNSPVYKPLFRVKRIIVLEG